MGLFFDQDWFDSRLQAAGLTRAALAQASGMTIDEIEQVYQDQRELEPAEVRAFARVLGREPREVANRSGAADPGSAPEAPFGLLTRIADNGTSVLLHWQPPARATDGDEAYGYVVCRFNEGEKLDLSNPQNILHITYDADQLQYTDNLTRPRSHYRYVVTAIDRLKNESAPSNVRELYIQ